MKVTLSPKASEYVKREARYLRSGSPRAAQQFADDLRRLRQALTRFPEMGKFTEEFPLPGILRFVMGPYLVDYQIMENEIRVFAIRHGRERPPGSGMDGDFDYEEPGRDPHSTER